MLLNVVYRFRSFSRFLKPSPKYLTHFTGVMFVVQTSPPCRQIIHRAIFIACSPTKPQGCTCTGNPVTITTTGELKIYIYIYIYIYILKVWQLVISLPTPLCASLLVNSIVPSCFLLGSSLYSL